MGKKLGMTGVFSAEGRYIPVTVIQAGPCVVTQIKTEMADGYNALQLGFTERKVTRTNKPLQGHFKKSGGKCFSFVREFSVGNPDEYTLGQTISAELFQIGEHIDVSGTTKGRGFSGVVKRHGFHGGKDTHGSKSHRVTGSIGCSAWPSRVIKGKKMPGHYGYTRKMQQNLEIIDIRPEENLIMLKGAVPGTVSGLVALYKKEMRK
jgi:large subunit ribosomal protein L3